MNHVTSWSGSWHVGLFFVHFHWGKLVRRHLYDDEVSEIPMSTPCKASSFQICACAVVNATVFGIRWVFIYYPYLIIMKTQLVETFYLGRYRNSDSWMRVGLCLFGFLFLFCSLYQSESWLRNKGEVASHRRNKNVNLSSDAGRCVLKSQSYALFGLFSPWRNSLQWTGEIFKNLLNISCSSVRRVSKNQYNFGYQ